jgi:hypothetical protein
MQAPAAESIVKAGLILLHFLKGNKVRDHITLNTARVVAGWDFRAAVERLNRRRRSVTISEIWSQ